MTIPALIDTLDHSGLHTVNSITGGYETPLINEYGLRPYMDALKAYNVTALAILIKDRHKAFEASRKVKVVGHVMIMG